MRTPVCLLLFAILVFGCGSFSPQTVYALANETHLSFELPARWEARGKEEWRSPNRDHLRFRPLRSDPRAQNAVVARETLDTLNKRGAKEAVDYMVRVTFSPPLPNAKDLSQVEGIWKKMMGAKTLLAKPAPDIKAARALLAQADLDFSKSAGDLRQRAERYPSVFSYNTAHHVDIKSLQPQQTAVGPAFAVDCVEAQTGKPVRFLVLEIGGRDAVFELNGGEEIPLEVLDKVASTLKVGVEAPPVVAQEKPEEESRSSRFPSDTAKGAIMAGLLLLFTSVPAALGASSGYRLAQLSGADPGRTAFKSAFSSTGASLYLATIASAVIMFVTLGPKGFSNPNLMGGIAVIVMTVIVLFGGACAAAVVALLAGLGASLGARVSARMCTLLAAIFAALGALLGPALLGNWH